MTVDAEGQLVADPLGFAVQPDLLFVKHRLQQHTEARQAALAAHES